MKPPRYTLRLIFGFSVFVSLCCIGIVFAPISKIYLPLPLLVGVVSLVTLAIAWLLFRGDRLIPLSSTGIVLFAAKISMWLFFSYIALVPIVAAFAWCSLKLIALFSSQPLDVDFALFIFIYALAFPLSLSPALASYLYCRNQRHAPG